MRLILLLAAAFASMVAFAIPSQAGPYLVDVVTDPAVPAVGKAMLRISVKSSGQPLPNADVRAITMMPGMPMGEREVAATATNEPGVYTAPATFPMEGAYEVRVTVNGSLGRAVAVIPIRTGERTTAGSTINYVRIGLWLLAFGVVAWVLWLMKRSGQTFAPRKMLSGTVLWSLLFLGIALAVAVYAVNNFRRPGSMTPLEAQGMEMSTPAPEGSTPVTLARAEIQRLGPTVRYTGQAVGFVEQDVIARVTGSLQSMPLYVGDRVKKGQVIARLDTSQLQPQLLEKQAGYESARRAVDVAESDYRQAQAGVAEAQAELDQYRGGLEEANANLASVVEDRKAADAELAASQSELANAEAGVKAAEADKSYAERQAERADKLYTAGAISLDQAQRTRAEATKAAAAVTQARQVVISSQARVLGAQANVRKGDAQITVAQKRIDQAQSMLKSHYAHVRTAGAAEESAAKKIAQARAEANEANAMLSGAVASKGYATISAEVDGVVTSRLISPGTLVNEGQAILRIAQVIPIRLQANVSEYDLASIRVGANVSVWHRGVEQKPLLAKVTSVSPSVDPSARTGVVEAVVPNSDRRFVPGQFVTMEIGTGSSQPVITIPRTAVWQAGNSRFVWVTHGSGTSMMAHKRRVETGSVSGNQIAIINGLREGEGVVVQGGADLREGQSISPQPADGLYEAVAG